MQKWHSGTAGPRTGRGSGLKRSDEPPEKRVYVHSSNFGTPRHAPAARLMRRRRIDSVEESQEAIFEEPRDLDGAAEWD